MAVDIPFVREIDPAYGELKQVSPLIRRVICENPGPFTFTGTGVYVLGQGDVAVIDPGPAGHEETLLRVLAGERVTHIFLTHGHIDHSPAASPLARATGAKIYANPAPVRRPDHDIKAEADDDENFRFDVALKDGERIAGKGWTLEALFTPGHTSNHTTFALLEENALFTGDHIMGWSTTVVSPPDGDMGDYFASLEKVRARNFATLWPTHGPPVRDPAPFLAAYRAHREAREAQILEQIKAGRTRITEMVPVMYAAVDPRLHPAAAHSVLAHTIRMTRAGLLKTDGAPQIDSVYALA
ncbi:MAG: MBL fold metallo-hydrolase [Hyphomonadaceae bacterium]